MERKYTYSRHRLLPEEIRDQLFGEIRVTIEQHGGVIASPRADFVYG